MGSLAVASPGVAAWRPASSSVVILLQPRAKRVSVEERPRGEEERVLGQAALHSHLTPLRTCVVTELFLI